MEQRKDLPNISSMELEPGPIPRSEVESICSVEQDPATKDYRFLRTSYRVKDPKRSIKFYNCLGMTLLNKIDMPELKASFYTMGYLDSQNWTELPPPSPRDVQERDYWAMTRSSTLELAYNWGTELDPSFNYNVGSGFGHISIMVPDVRKATERLQKFGVIFSKTPDEGGMKGLAFFPDPDGYFIEMYDEKAVRDNI